MHTPECSHVLSLRILFQYSQKPPKELRIRALKETGLPFFSFHFLSPHYLRSVPNTESYCLFPSLICGDGV